MGMLNAMAITETETTLEQQLSWHLQGNHYPPIPQAMIPACVQAIEAMKDGDAERRILLGYDGIDKTTGEPFQILWRNQPTAPAWAIAEHAHLDAWLMMFDEDEDLWDEEDD